GAQQQAQGEPGDERAPGLEARLSREPRADPLGGERGPEHGEGARGGDVESQPRDAPRQQAGERGDLVEARIEGPRGRARAGKRRRHARRYSRALELFPAGGRPARRYAPAACDAAPISERSSSSIHTRSTSAAASTDAVSAPADTRPGPAPFESGVISARPSRLRRAGGASKAAGRQPSSGSLMRC